MRNSKDYLPKLLEFIELANKIPPGFKIPEYLDVLELTRKRLGKSAKRYSADDLADTYRELLREYPSDLYNFVFKKQSEDESEGKAILDRVNLLTTISHTLRALAFAIKFEHLSEVDFDDYDEFESFDDLEELEDANEILEGLDDDFSDEVPFMKVQVTINEDGFLEAKTNEFFELISNYKIDAKRIRNCMVCPKIFWANRIDKWTCSKTCGNTLRQRIWQQENKDEYNEKRRSNYAYKKSMKKQKEKPNGTL